MFLPILNHIIKARLYAHYNNNKTHSIPLFKKPVLSKIECYLIRLVSDNIKAVNTVSVQYSFKTKAINHN